MDINTIYKLSGLKASDRTAEEQKAVNQVMGYKEQPAQENIKINTNTGLAPTKLPQGVQLGTAPALTKQPTLADKIKAMAPEYAHMTELYKEGLEESGAKFGYGRNTVSANASDYLDKVSNEVSSYYKKYKGTSKLNDSDLTPQKVKSLAMDYQAREKAYGKDAAAYWLDKQYKEIVANNQSWMEQAWNGFSHLVPSVEGGAVELAGNIWGTINPIVSLIDNDLKLPETEGMGWWHNYLNNIIDNPVTRLGHDIERAGASYAVQSLYNMLDSDSETARERIASMKNSATKYNPEGIGSDAIVLTEDQENSIINSATPWEAMQSSGFTTLSMLTGAGLAGAANKAFGLVTKGANYLNKAGKILKTTEGLEKALINIKKAQNATNMFVVPGLTGGVEGMQEGLNTKMQVEHDNIQKLDDFYKDKIEKEVAARYAEESKKPQVMTEIRDADGNKRMVQTGGKGYAQIYKEVFDKYQNEYLDARKQIEFAASEAGVHNFYANSLINGMLNMTLKAGLQSDRVQETLRNSKLFGWAYKKPKFTINADGTVKPKFTKLGAIGQYIKEPIGEGIEEFSQSLSNDTFAGAAGNNIDEFIKRRFSGDGNVQVGDMFASDYGAGWSAFTNSWTKADTWKSAVLGAVGSVMGSASMAHRGYRRDENGNLVKGGYWGRQLKADGTQESAFEAAARMTPWRSGLVNSYFDRRRERQQADKAAEHIQEWLQDPKNQAKWDGLVGTASWMNAMHNAAESNDQYNFRNAQMGKAINDAIMLSQLEGTDLYETIMADLKRSSEMDVTSQEGQSIIEQMRNSGNEDFQNKTDEEVIDKIKSNANKMLAIMSQVEESGAYFDRLLGRVDDNTKHSLIFGKMMEKNFAERKEALEQEINRVKGEIKNSRGASMAELEEDLKSLIIKYGSIKQAMHAEESLKDKKEKAEKRKEELEAIGKDKLTDKQKEELEAKTNEIKVISQQLSTFTGLHEKDEKGRDTGKGRSDLATLVLNEQEIMDLDNATRAMMLARGAARYYNATHQNRQKVDELNLQIDEIQKQIDALEEQKKKWVDEDGHVRKGHNKQVQRNDKAIEQLEKDKYAKMRELDTERGESENSKQVYSEAQQAVIDNLMQQAQAVDEDFLDKAVDIARLEKGVKNYHQQLQSILSDPKAFSNYVERVKFNTAQDLLRRRAERVARIEDYKEFSRELDKLMAGASEIDMMTIMNVMRENNRKIKDEDARQREAERIDRIINDEEDGRLVINENGDIQVGEDTETREEELETNWDRYRKNQENQELLINQFAKNTHLTDNDMSLLVDAMQYLAQEGIDVTDRENAVDALLEKDEQGNIGGKLRQWVEERNAALPQEQRTFMPQFTSIGQVVNDYVELLNGVEKDRIDRTTANPIIVPISPVINPIDNSVQPTVSPTPSSPFSPTQSASEKPSTPQQEEQQNKPKGKSIFDIGYDSANGGQFVDNEGTVATEAAVEAGRERRGKEEKEDTPKTSLEEAFSKITTPEIASSVNLIDNLLDSMRFTEDGNNVALTDEEKNLARQSLMDIAVNNEEILDTMEDLIDAIHGKANELQDLQSKMEDSSNKKYGHAAEVLSSLARRLKVSSTKRRTIGPKGRPANPSAGIISTANIAYIQSKNPNAWAVRFMNDHAIDEWNRNNTITTDTPVYFITNSEWTAEVTSEMNDNKESRDYNRDADMPLVAAVEVETPKNLDTTTAIQVGGKWYQPIGVMPGGNSTSVNGAARTTDIRSRASQEQGIHLVTENGMPNGKPLVTKVAGKNYIDAHHPDDTQNKRENNQDNNHDLMGAIVQTLPPSSIVRLSSLSHEELIKDPEYQEAREKFLNRISWGDGFTGSLSSLNGQPLYTPDDLKHNEGKSSDKSAQPMILFRRPMAETTARNSDQTLREVLENGSLDDIVSFNSRTQRLYNEVIRPLFEHLPLTDKHNDRSAKLIEDANPEALQEEADRLTKLFNGYDGTKETSGLNGLSNFIYIPKGNGYSIRVVANPNNQVAGDSTTAKSEYLIYLANDDTTMPISNIGIIEVGQGIDNIENAKTMLKNLLQQCTDGLLKDSAYWQVPSYDIKHCNDKDSNIASKARKNIGAIVDDGILELGGSSLVYDTDGLKFYAPVNNEGKPAFSIDKFANKNNAQPSAPINTTPQGQGSTITRDGTQVDPDSGAVLDDNHKPSKPKTPQETEGYKRAKSVAEKIVADSKDFVLSEDDSHYYIEDKATGQRTKYLRVTTVIGADETAKQWFPNADELASKLGIDNFDEDLASVINDLQNGSFNSKEQREKIVELISKKHGVSKEQVKRAFAELKTEHKRTAYGAWSTPSTAIGNTADIIVRDFFAGKLKDSYPNINEEVLDNFTKQLGFFKDDLEAKGITLVSEGVMAHGKITVTDNNGKAHEVNVAGTLDLFGYDRNGNFYIFDMKTKRNATTDKLQYERAKWSRQVSMYADLLKQTYGVDVKHDNLRIIPISVDYPAPRGKDRGMSIYGPVYFTNADGQLQMQQKDGTVMDFIQTDTKGFTMMYNTLDKLYQPGYTPFSINWDNLSSEDQDIAESLGKEVHSTNDEPASPERADIVKPERRSLIDTGLEGKPHYEGSTPITPANPAPIRPAGSQQEGLVSWDKLSQEIKDALKELGWTEDEETYNDILDDQPSKEAMINDLKCRGLL